jgi:hypothetical protein
MPVSKGGTFIVGDDLRRFWSKVARRGSCAEWQGPLDKDGYGKFMTGPARNQKTHRPHRWIYEQFTGVPLGDRVLRHRCDNPKCVEVEHLVPGTQKDNMIDCATKGRIKHKLTKRQVLAIRRAFADGATQAGLARQYKVSFVAVHNVVLRRTWQHV